MVATDVTILSIRPPVRPFHNIPIVYALTNFLETCVICLSYVMETVKHNISKLLDEGHT